ncbi:signal peptidase I [Sutcliffiella horikoshii]|uniref:signal peptidase I n=1 Tax=Sutcliffiella horikoshii TaxID=79883 RepID=UPI001CBC2D2C|nr:signal peptidase I [Sutcliffiella horikoshii]UAL48564.1 signal peptidase I [Sutcliffiella horikoshii]
MKEKITKRKSAMKWLVVTFLLVLMIRALFFSNYIVEGHSMNPTLEQGNFLMVNKMVYSFTKPERFDVVVFQQEDEDTHYVKRVIGLPGDQIEYKQDMLYVNGEQVTEPFISPERLKIFGGNFTGDFSLEELTGEEAVPKGHVFVIGDNRLNSLDSRHFGFIEIEDIVGKVHVRYWPFDEFNTTFK